MEIIIYKNKIDISNGYHKLITYKPDKNNNFVLKVNKLFNKIQDYFCNITVIEINQNINNFIIDLTGIKKFKYLKIENNSNINQNILNINLDKYIDYIEFLNNAFILIKNIKTLKKFTNKFIFKFSEIYLNNLNKLFNSCSENFSLIFDYCKIKDEKLDNINISNITFLDTVFIKKSLIVKNSNIKKLELLCIDNIESIYFESNIKNIKIYNTKVNKTICKNSITNLLIEHSEIQKIFIKNIDFLNIDTLKTQKIIISYINEIKISYLQSEKMVLFKNKILMFNINYNSNFYQKLFFIKDIETLILFLDIIQITIDIFNVIVIFFDSIYKDNFIYNIKQFNIKDNSVLISDSCRANLKNIFFLENIKKYFYKNIQISTSKDIKDIFINLFRIYNKYGIVFPDLINFKYKKIKNNLKQKILKI